MNSRQEKFAREIVAGKSQVDAYREAYPRSRNWKEGTARKRASELMRRKDVARKVAELRSEADTAASMDCMEARGILSALVRRLDEEGGSTTDLCRAVMSLARISGWLTPDALAVFTPPPPPISPEERERRICEILGMPYEPEPPTREELERRTREIRAREAEDAARHV